MHKGFKFQLEHRKCEVLSIDKDVWICSVSYNGSEPVQRRYLEKDMKKLIDNGKIKKL